MDLKKAVISDCGRYRYELHRTWDEKKEKVLFIMLNPSTADGMKDGIYYTKANGGTTYFVLNEKVLMKLMGSVYKTTKHFVFGDWKQELEPGMVEQFDEVYNEVKQW